MEQRVLGHTIGISFLGRLLKSTVNTTAIFVERPVARMSVILEGSGTRPG
jgi:hypothetical protein